MSNFPQQLQNDCPEKNSNFKNMNILYIALKHEPWKFRICNYLREMFKFRDLINTLRSFAESVFARIFAKFKYLAEQFISTNSPDHVL